MVLALISSLAECGGWHRGARRPGRDAAFEPKFFGLISRGSTRRSHYRKGSIDQISTAPILGAQPNPWRLMIDLIKTLVDTLTQIIPRISEMRTDKRRQEIGAGLFILYVRMNETLLVADDIIASLETYAERMRRHLNSGDDAYALTAGSWIINKIEHQITNFERIDELLHDKRALLQIIDAESYNRLFPLLDHKFGAISYLLRIMRSGSLPLSLSSEDWATMMSVGRNQSALHRVMHDLRPCWRENELSTTTEWEREVYDKVVAYLQEREPRKQITEIRAALSSLREALERNFSITDILPEVGDRRMESRWLPIASMRIARNTSWRLSTSNTNGELSSRTSVSVNAARTSEAGPGPAQSREMSTRGDTQWASS